MSHSTPSTRIQGPTQAKGATVHPDGGGTCSGKEVVHNGAAGIP